MKVCSYGNTLKLIFEFLRQGTGILNQVLDFHFDTLTFIKGIF